MKLSQYAYLAFALSGGLVASSCIRDEIPDCPPLRVEVVVKDKNYFNVDKVESEERRSEDLPFREYVRNYYWVLRNASTGAVVDGASDLIPVSGDEEYVTPEICPCIPHGKYILTVWGGLDSKDHLTENLDKITFHPGNTQGSDVYMTNDTLIYDAWHDYYLVELERTKGKLIVEKINVPAQFTHTEKNISGIFANLSHHNFAYSGETSVKAFGEILNHQKTVTKTILSPSIIKDGTRLDMKFNGIDVADATPIIDARSINITMHRNELTAVRYVWDEETATFKIYVLINDAWEMVNHMDVE